MHHIAGRKLYRYTYIRTFHLGTLIDYLSSVKCGKHRKNVFFLLHRGKYKSTHPSTTACRILYLRKVVVFHVCVSAMTQYFMHTQSNHGSHTVYVFQQCSLQEQGLISPHPEVGRSHETRTLLHGQANISVDWFRV